MLGKVHPLVVDHCQSCSLDLAAHSEQVTVLFTSIVNVRKLQSLSPLMQVVGSVSTEYIMWLGIYIAGAGAFPLHCTSAPHLSRRQTSSCFLCCKSSCV